MINNNINTNNTNYGYLRDINGDKCQKTLLGIVIGIIWLIMSIVVIIYGLGHAIKSQNIVIDTLWAMATVSGVLLGLTTIQKQRNNNSNNNYDSKNKINN